ncbi:MAG: flagellar biosynthesis protein FlhB [Inquilinus sp.]|nr:flagellar biosynthesis protein FlhB [Inquilinus sp.]
MADDKDDSQKTEEPTQRKLEEARRRGQVVTSQEVKHGFVLLGGLIVVLAFAPLASRALTSRMGSFLAGLHTVPTDADSLIAMLGDAAGEIVLILLFPLLVLAGLAAASSLLQHGPLLSFETLKPKLEKISPLAGFKRQFSLKAIMEFSKGLAKIAVVGIIAAIVLWPELRRIEAYAGLPMAALTARVWTIAVKLMTAVLAVVALIAGADFLFQRFDFLRRQRMSKQEVKDEYKQTEGDPMVKARVRQIRMERARRRMMAAVPEADVVITNPTHFAVAMAYKPDTMTAPKVVAKGVDAIALKIREVAEAHDVAVVENPPLARALYQAVEIDGEIPAEHYKAVAEVISYVFKLQRRTMPAT